MKGHKYQCAFQVGDPDSSKVAIEDISASAPGIIVNFKNTGNPNTSIIAIDAQSASGSVHYNFYNKNYPIYTNTVSSKCTLIG